MSDLFKIKVTRATPNGPVVEEIAVPFLHEGYLTFPAQGYNDDGDLSGQYTYKVLVRDLVGIEA